MGQRDFRASSDQLHDRIIAAATDGRCHNVRYRQNQMQLLHVFLCKNGDRICHAIQQDSSGTEDEALSEYYFALSSLRTLYDQLNFDYALVEEYSIKTNKSNTRKRAPHGIIMIRPGNYSRFFSIISPFVAAVAAGNCVLIEVRSKQWVKGSRPLTRVPASEYPTSGRPSGPRSNGSHGPRCIYCNKFDCVRWRLSFEMLHHWSDNEHHDSWTFCATS